MKHLLLVTIIFLLSSIPLYAAEDKTIKIDEVVVAATRYEEKVTSIPAKVTVISEDDIKNSTAQNIPDLLRNEGGIYVNDIAGNKRNMTVDIRGFGETAPANTLVLVDGRRVNQADLSGTDWTQIPLERVEKIEIMRGGRGSILYGDNATGGVINIITKEGDIFKATSGVAVGSYDTYKGTASLSGSSDTFSYALSGGYESSDGHRDNSNREDKDAGMRVNLYLSDALKFNLSSGYHKDNTGLPGALKESDFAAGFSRTETINPHDFAEVEDYYIKGSPEVYFFDNSLGKVDISYRKRSFLSFASFASGEFLGDDEIKTITISPQVVLKNNIKNISNSLTFGFDYQTAEKNILNDSLFFGTRTIGTFRLEKKNYGYYIHNEITIADKIHLSGGYRYDKADFFFRPSSPDHTDMDEDLYTAGINYHFYGKSYAYFSFSKSYRYPLLDELFSFFTSTINTSLIPQFSNDYELGIRYYLTDTVYAHVNLFRIKTENEIFYNAAAFANENLDGTSRRHGIECSLGARIFPWLTFNGSYTYMDAKIQEGSFEDKDIPNIPHDKVTLETIASPVKGFSISLIGAYIGERPFISDFSNTFGKQEDYIVINGKVKYQWKFLTAFLDINNITDEEYAEYGVLGGFPLERAFYPSPKRNFLAGLSVEF